MKGDLVEHFKKDMVPDAVGDIKKANERRYGDTVLSFLKIKT